MAGDETPKTSRDAYEAVVESGEDVILRRRVAAVLAGDPKTTHEIIQKIDGKKANTIRPRVTELIRMGCVKRLGTRENPSGHEAYVNHLTPLGEKYALGDADPTPRPTTATLKAEVVDTARAFLRGNATERELRVAVMKHDDAKRDMDPEWEP